MNLLALLAPRLEWIRHNPWWGAVLFAVFIGLLVAGFKQPRERKAFAAILLAAAVVLGIFLWVAAFAVLLKVDGR